MHRYFQHTVFRPAPVMALLIAFTMGLTAPLSAQELTTRDLSLPSGASTQGSEAPQDQQVDAAERALLEGLANGGPQQDSVQPKAVHAKGKDESPIKLVSFDQKASMDAFDGALPDPRLETKPLPSQARTDNATASTRSPRITSETSPSHPENQEPAKVQAANPNAAMKRELEASQKRVSELERQLEEVRGQLTMAETELSRLSSIAEARSRANLGLPSLQESPRAMVRPAQPSLPKEPKAEPMPTSADLEIVTVAVDKADLRLGPGKSHSPLMSVARGARLAVEVRQGEWLRVFAPNGQRAWIYSGSVTFGNRTGTDNRSSAVKVRGYSSSLEDEAFKRVQSITSGY